VCMDVMVSGLVLINYRPGTQTASAMDFLLHARSGVIRLGVFQLRLSRMLLFELSIYSSLGYFANMSKCVEK
jgi:hypothetical protein